MQVQLEAIEDLYFLSHTSVVVTQASSHFSTVAALLSWARTGVRDWTSAVYVDAEGIAGGQIQPSLVSATLNSSRYVPDWPLRWMLATTKFIEGIVDTEEEIALPGIEQVHSIPPSACLTVQLSSQGLYANLSINICQCLLLLFPLK